MAMPTLVCPSPKKSRRMGFEEGLRLSPRSTTGESTRTESTQVDSVRHEAEDMGGSCFTSPKRPRPIYRSAPSFSSLDARIVLGTRAEVLASLTIQDAWRQRGLLWRVMEKPSHLRLGVAFSPSYLCHSVLITVDAGGVAHAAGLRAGDRVVRINGDLVDGLPPGATARRLRGSSGRIKMLVQPAARVDIGALQRTEWALSCKRAEAAIAASSSGGAHTDECAVCFSLLCQPVRWGGPVDAGGTGCDHLFCRGCLKAWAGHATESGNDLCCPLCRAPPPVAAASLEGWLQVDRAAATLLEQRHPTAYAQALETQMRQ